MFQLKNIIYIHNLFRPTAKQSERDYYNTGSIMSERDDAQKNTNVAVYSWNVSYFYYPY